MDNRNYDLWEEGFYGTGPLHEKKDNNMLIAVLLVLVIFLCGVVSFLSILNIRLFRKLNQPKEMDLSVSFASEPAEETAPMEPPAENVQMELQSSDLSVETLPEQGALSLQDIYSSNIDSVVSVTASGRGTHATGTGVIFSARGYIVTNHHVIENAEAVRVKLSDNRELDARLIGADDISDLAVLYVADESLKPARFGDSDRLRVGDTVVAIGDPLGENLRGTMTNGIISAINRDISMGGMKLNLIQTNAALNSGNSGGPLINCYGQVVGINTMKIGAFTDAAGVEGIGFALPSLLVRDVVEQLMTNGYVSGRPTLGISGETLASFYQHYYRMPAGLYITDVEPGGPCAQVGLTQGDILLRLDDTEIHTPADLNEFLFSHSIGDEVTLEVFRRGKIGTTSVVLEERTH